MFQSWGKEIPTKFSRTQLEEILTALNQETGDYGTVLRAKGIVPTSAGGWLHFDLVPGQFEVRDGGADYTGRLCVIGAELNRSALDTLFGLS